MTQLTFTKDNTGMYVATATVNSDFAIHLERNNVGYVGVDLTSIQNKEYQPVFGKYWEPIFDKDFHATVFPKYLKIKSSVQPTSGYITENS